MSLQKLFKQTAIYGIATVVPRMFSLLLTPLYTTPGVMDTAKFGEVNIIFAYLVFFNVVLAYGMETAFFRYYHAEDKKQVVSTSTISLFWSSIGFLGLALLCRRFLADAAGIDVEFITYTIWVLVFDALVIVPFSKLRAEGKPGLYATVKIGNVMLNVALNFFFLLYLPNLAKVHAGFFDMIYIKNFEVGYVFVANVIASLLTFMVFLPHYFRISWKFDSFLWKRMMRYSLPVMAAGIAFAINEVFDRPLLQFMNIPDSEIGTYSACYRLAIFMTLFTTAFRLGIEPFFFSHSGSDNATETYAAITKYFVILGSLILLGVVVFADVLKLILLQDPAFWEAMDVVPLIVLANFFLGIYINLSVWYKLSDKTKMGAYISWIGAAITLAFNFALIPVWGYMGSAVATISAYGIMMVISYYMSNKYYPIPYDIKTISSYLGLSIVLSAISFYVPIFRETFIFGIVAIIAFCYLIYRNEKEVLLRIIKARQKEK